MSRPIDDINGAAKTHLNQVKKTEGKVSFKSSIGDSKFAKLSEEITTALLKEIKGSDEYNKGLQDKLSDVIMGRITSLKNKKDLTVDDITELKEQIQKTITESSEASQTVKEQLQNLISQNLNNEAEKTQILDELKEIKEIQENESNESEDNKKESGEEEKISEVKEGSSNEKQFLEKSFSSVKTYISNSIDSFKKNFEVFDEKITSFNKSITTTISSPFNLISLKISDMGKNISETIKKPFEGITEKISSFKDSIGEKIKAPFEGITEKISSFKDSIGEKIKAPFKGITDKFSSFSKSIGEGFDSLKNNVSEGFKSTLGGLGEKISNMNPLKLFKKNKKEEKKAKELDSALDKLINRINGIFDNFIEYALDFLKQIIIPACKILAKGINILLKPIIAAFWTTIGPILAIIAAGVAVALPIIAKAIEELAPFIGKFLVLIGEALNKFLDLLGKLFDFVVEKIWPFFETQLWPFLKNEVWPMIKKLIDWVMDKLDSIWDTIIVPVLETLKDLLETLWTALKPYVQPLIDIVLTTLIDLLNIIKPVIIKIAETCRDIFMPVLDLIKSIVVPVIQGIKKIVDWVVEKIKNIISNIAKLIEDDAVKGEAEDTTEDIEVKLAKYKEQLANRSWYEWKDKGDDEKEIARLEELLAQKKAEETGVKTKISAESGIEDYKKRVNELETALKSANQKIENLQNSGEIGKLQKELEEKNKALSEARAKTIKIDVGTVSDIFEKVKDIYSVLKDSIEKKLDLLMENFNIEFQVENKQDKVDIQNTVSQATYNNFESTNQINDFQKQDLDQVIESEEIKSKKKNNEATIDQVIKYLLDLGNAIEMNFQSIHKKLESPQLVPIPIMNQSNQALEDL